MIQACGRRECLGPVPRLRYHEGQPHKEPKRQKPSLFKELGEADKDFAGRVVFWSGYKRFSCAALILRGNLGLWDWSKHRQVSAAGNVHTQYFVAAFAAEVFVESRAQHASVVTYDVVVRAIELLIAPK